MNNNLLAPVLEPSGFELLNELSMLGPFTEELGEKLNRGLRKREVGPELVAAILTQLELRESARAKFGDFAQGMLLTRPALEQATRLTVAAQHAARFRRAGCHKVADLGCGIGAESLALAGLGLMVEAFEIDETNAAAALVNLRAFPEAHVTHADYTQVDWKQLRDQGVDGAFADPARRDERGRKLKPECWQPPLSTVLQLQDEIPRGNLGIKCAPGILHRYLPPNSEVTWISVDGELVEAGIWCGDLREKPGRNALLLDGEGQVRARLRNPEEGQTANKPSVSAEVIAGEEALGHWIFEPDPAIIRAGLLAQVAKITSTASVSPGIAYLCGNDSPGSEALKLGAWFEVVEVLALDAKKLRAAMKHRRVRALEVKKRGADVAPERLRREVLGRAVPEGEDFVLFATRIAGRHRAILAQRFSTQTPSPSSCI